MKLAGSAGAALAASSLLPSFAHAQSQLDPTASSSQPLNIGVLFPESQLYPGIGSSLLAGLQLALTKRNNIVGGQQVRLLPKMYTGRFSSATQQIRDLLAEQQVDLLVGMVSSATLAPLHSLIEARRVPLIITNVGANVVRSRAENPYFFRVSLDDWRANWAMGAWAANHVGKRAFVTTSFYESGYDFSYMFARGLEHGQGTVVGRSVTHVPRVADTLTPMLAAIKQSKPDFVYAAYSGRQALEFMRAYDAAGLAGQVPLVGSAFLFAEEWLPQYGQAALQGISGSAWSPELDTPENLAFTQAYRAATGRPADPFALLGYDAGRVVADAVEATPRAPSWSDQLRHALATRQMSSPRGNLAMSPVSQSGSTPLYIREVRQQNGSLSNAVIARSDPTAELAAELAAIRASVKTGWLDPYLAV